MVAETVASIPPVRKKSTYMIYLEMLIHTVIKKNHARSVRGSLVTLTCFIPVKQSSLYQETSGV